MHHFYVCCVDAPYTTYSFLQLQVAVTRSHWNATPVWMVALVFLILERPVPESVVLAMATGIDWIPLESVYSALVRDQCYVFIINQLLL